MYLWMVIVGAFFCCAMAWGIGANDVANFFGTPVGAKAITLKKAMIIAFIGEFIGAFALGGEVTKTIRKGIVVFDVYNGEADILLLGMFSALIAASLWVYLATKYSLPVSTTQSIVGAIIGFALVSKGSSAVEWDKIIDIIIFWFGTPLLGCIACTILYWPFRHFVLIKDNSYALSLKLYPFFWFIVVFVMITFLLFKGLKRFPELGDWAEVNQGFVVLIGFGAGCVAALIAWIALVNTGFAARYAEKAPNDEEDNDKKGDIESQGNDEDVELKKVTSSSEIQQDLQSKVDGEADGDNDNNKTIKIGSIATSGLNVDVFEDLTAEEQDIQKHAIEFDTRTERLFEWLQVLAATFGIFAHGSNDVANAIAPFTAIYSLSKSSPTDDINEKNEVSLWILFMGSIFMSIGCVTYGYNCIKTLGVKLTKISPTRGYFTQLGAAIVIIFASNYGFPASSTHCQVGATIAIGLVERFYADKKLPFKKIFNWKLLLQVFFGWIATIVIGGGTSALIFSVMAYSPCNN